jgi:hypothetical protein
MKDLNCLLISVRKALGDCTLGCLKWKEFSREENSACNIIPHWRLADEHPCRYTTYSAVSNEYE